MAINKTYHLALDLGATSGRSVLASFDGERVEMTELTRFHYPMLPIGGHLFWNLPLIYQEVLGSLREARKRIEASGESLTSVGIDTWGCDVAYFYADGTLAGLPYCYRDPHTTDAVNHYTRHMERGELYGRTGIQFMDFNTLFQLDTLRRDGAAVLDAADKILFMPDALIYMLTGRAVTEFTVASTSQMLNLATGDFDEILLGHLGLSRSKFGPMVKPATVIGGLTGEVMHHTGLGSDVKVIAVAGHDTASAVIGIPTADDSYAYLSCGTWALLGVESPQPNSGSKALEYNFTNEGGIDGTTRLLKNICGMWIFERVREELGLGDADISTLAASCHDSQCDTIINSDDPAFANPKSMVGAINEYCSLHGLETPVTSADYIRVIYRSLACRVGEVLGWLKELSPNALSRLHVIGGGSRNAHLMQMLADETLLPVIAGPAECTALGNILVQLRGCGSVDSLPAMRAIAAASTDAVIYHPEI